MPIIPIGRRFGRTRPKQMFNGLRTRSNKIVDTFFDCHMVLEQGNHRNEDAGNSQNIRLFNKLVQKLLVMKKILGIEFSITKENIRLYVGTISYICVLIVFIMVCIFGYNGKPEHIELIKIFLYVSQGLLGLNIVKEGINLNIGHSNKTEQHSHNHSYDDCIEKRKKGVCLGINEGLINNDSGRNT